MKFEIEKQFRVTMGKFQFYTYADGNYCKGFDTEKEAEAFLDALAEQVSKNKPFEWRKEYHAETREEFIDRHTQLYLTDDRGSDEQHN